MVALFLFFALFLVALSLFLASFCFLALFSISCSLFGCSLFGGGAGQGGVEAPAREGISCRHRGDEGEVRQSDKVKRLKKEFLRLSRVANFGCVVVVNVTHR